MSYNYIVKCSGCNATGTSRFKAYDNRSYIRPPEGWMMSVDVNMHYLCFECGGAVNPYECEDCTPTTYPPTSDGEPR